MRRCIGFAVAIIVLFAGAAGAQPANEAVLRATLPNGMRVVVVPNRLAPVVATSLNYLVGSTDAPDGFPGTAHALEHMMFRGDAQLDKDQLFELGARLGGAYNASTSDTLTQYTYTVPAADLALVLRIEAGRMRGLTLSDADWAQERGAISQEVSRNLSSPMYRFSAAVRAALYSGTPYEFDALGSRPTFDRTDAALLRGFYDRWYAPNNAILVIAGDVVAEDALAAARAAFAAIPARPLPQRATMPAPLAAVQPGVIEMQTSQPVGLAGLALRMPGVNDPDFAAADILGDVLSSPRGAVQALVPAGRALSARFSYNAMPGAGIGLLIASFPAGGDPGALLDDMRGVLARVAADGVPADLVEAAKRKEIAQVAFQTDSIAGLARAWSTALAIAGADSPDALARAYEGVTPADVNRVARRLLGAGAPIAAILTPQSLTAQSGAPAAAIETRPAAAVAEAVLAAPDRPVTLPSWASDALAEARPPAPVAPPTVTTLPNGLRLIVQPERVSRTVSVFGRVREVSETAEPPGKDGVAALAGRLFDEGTELRSRLEMKKAMDDIGATGSAGFGFSLKVLSPQFEAGMALLAEGVLRPAFKSAAVPAEDYDRIRRQLAQGVAGLPRSPDYRVGRAVAAALLPGNDPGLRQSTPDSIASVRQADAAAFYAAYFRPDLATIVVIGDVTPEAAGRVVAAEFGAWTAAGAAPAIDLPPIGPNRASSVRVTDPGSLQDSVTLAETVTLPVHDPARYALLLGNTILGGDFSSRLYRDLRVRTGYVYSVRSSLDWSRTRARHVVAFGADAANVGPARELVLRNLRDMQANPVSAADLARAKAQVLRRLALARGSTDGIAGLYLRQAELDLPLDTPQQAAERYAGITAEQIRDAFATWLRPDDLVQVVKGPPLP